MIVRQISRSDVNNCKTDSKYLFLGCYVAGIEPVSTMVVSEALSHLWSANSGQFAFGDAKRSTNLPTMSRDKSQSFGKQIC